MVRLGGKRREGKHSVMPYCVLVLMGRASIGQVNCSGGRGDRLRLMGQ